jgi:hypothetical protein
VGQFGAVGVAHCQARHFLTRVAVFVAQQILALVDPAFAPLRKGDQDRHQILALGREPVFDFARVGLGRAPLEDAFGHQLAQARTQYVFCYSQFLLELAEAAPPEQGLAHDEQRPPLAHQFEGLCDGAGHVGKGHAFHIDMMGASVA